MKSFLLVPSASIPCVEQLVRAQILAFDRRLKSSGERSLVIVCVSSSARDMVNRAIKSTLGIRGGIGVGMIQAVGVKSANGRSSIAAITDSIVKANSVIGGDESVVVSPIWWYLGSDIDIDEINGMMMADDRIKGVRLGGWYSVHSTGDPIYRLSRIDGSRLMQISSTNCHAIRYYDPNAPQLIRVSAFTGGVLGNLSDTDMADFARETNFGADKSRMFAYPSWFSRRSGDGLSDPFADVIGTDRAYRDRDSRFDDEIGSLSGERFESRLF